MYIYSQTPVGHHCSIGNSIIVKRGVNGYKTDAIDSYTADNRILSIPIL